MPASADATALAVAAVQHDRNGEYAQAIRVYRQAADALFADAQATKDESLFAKVNEYRARAIELETALGSKTSSSLPVNPINAIDALNAAEAKAKQGGGARVVTGAAVVGGAVGAVCLGPLSAVAMAGAMAYGTTRKDSVGTVARGAGKAAANTFSSLRRWNKDYKVTDKIGQGVSSGLDKITTTMSAKAGDTPSAPPAQRG